MITQKELQEWDNPEPIDWLAEAKKIETPADYINFADAAVESVAKEVEKLRAEHDELKTAIRALAELTDLQLKITGSIDVDALIKALRELGGKP